MDKKSERNLIKLEIEKLQKEIQTLEWSTSYTTRPRRQGEIHGKDYFFITEKEFITRKDNKEFIEWAKVNDPALLRIKTDVDKSALKVLITEEGVLISTQGEIIPDVEVVPGQTSVKFITE